MRKLLQPSYRVGNAVGRLENDNGLQGLHQTALAGDSKLFPEVGPDMGNWMDFHKGETLLSFHHGICRRQ